MSKSTKLRKLIKATVLSIAVLVAITQITISMKQQKTLTEFQDPEIVSQRFVIDGEQFKAISKPSKDIFRKNDWQN